MLRWKLSFPLANVIFYDFDNLHIMEHYINKYTIDSCIVYSMPGLLSANYLDLLKGIKLNIHPSRLPQFRGPNPVIHQILSNEDIYVTIHEIDQGEDSGDILVSSKVIVQDLKSYKNLDYLIIDEAIEILKDLMSTTEIAPRIKQDLTIKGKRAKRLTEQQIVKLLETKSFEHEVVIKLLSYRPHLIRRLITKTNYSMLYSYDVSYPQITNSSSFVIPSGVFYYNRRISLSRLLKSLIKIILMQR